MIVVYTTWGQRIDADLGDAVDASVFADGEANDDFAGELTDEHYDESELAMALAGLPSVPEPV